MMKMLGRVFALLALSVAVAGVFHGSAHAYNNNRLMDDAIFDNVNSMSEQQIRDFINSRPSSCLAQSGAIFPEPITYWQYGGNVDAARVIYNAAHYSDVNPQVILATLQKEQSLITRTNCYESSGIDSRNKAMGMGCPDGGACPAPGYAGFHQQVMKGTWLLGFARHRAVGDVNWGDNGSITYTGPMTQGTFKQCASCQPVYFDGWRTIDGQAVHMDTGATASFYYYTPHVGQSLPGIFESWFGSTWVPSYSWQLVGQRVIKYGTSQDLDISGGVPTGERMVFYIRALNTGTVTWSNTGPNPVRIGTSKPNDRTSVFCESSWLGCHRPVQMVESSVAPGEVGTFQFAVQAPATTGTYNEYFNLLAEGYSWMNDLGLYFNIKVVPLNFNYSVISDTLPTQLLSGATGSGTVTLRNDSNGTWYNTTKYPFRLGTSNPPDRKSQFKDTSWVGETRLANQNEFMVAPGQQATFTATLKAPPVGSTYDETYALVADGIKWSDQIIHHNILVKQDYDASLDSSSTSIVTMGGADRTQVTIKYLNTGAQTWTNNGPNPIRLGTTSSDDRTSGFCSQDWIACHRPAQLVESSVAPGSIGTFQFYLEGKPYFNSNPYTERFVPLLEGVKRFGATSSIKVNYTHQTYSWQLSDQYARTTGPSPTPVDMTNMTPGQTIIVGFKARNTGTATWYNSGGFPIRVATSRPTDRASAFCSSSWIACHRPVVMSENTVAPGQVGTFEFEFKAPASPTGHFNEYFVPIVEGYTYLNDIGLYFSTTVSP